MEQKDLQKITTAIERTVRGDTDAYNTIVTAYMQKLYRTALSLCGNAALAEDLAQETFIDGYLHLYKLREPEKIEGWLCRILKNKTLNALMRTRKTEPYDTLHAYTDNRTPESLYVSGESMREWRERFDSLSPAVKETATLYFMNGLTMAEISERTSTPLGTVKRRIHDARAKLRGETEMAQDKNTLPDSFAEALAVKIRDLENYTKTYGNVGFDTAYENVKTLISNLSSADDVKEYSVKSAKIASDTDTKYSEEALAVYRKFGNVQKASDLLIDMCDKFWAWNANDKRLDYTKNRIIPELSSYPDSNAKHIELGRHYFWMAYCVDKTTDEGIAEAKEYLSCSVSEYEKAASSDAKYPAATYGAAIAAQKALECLADGRVMKRISVTGESWLMEDDNLYYGSQPGCSYAYSQLDKYLTNLFWRASARSDRYFFPVTVPIEAGAEEKIESYYGGDAIRRVIATDEVVITPAGRFEDCLHLEVTIGEDSWNTWYCRGVGIVKATTPEPAEAKVLSTYNICGGEGWLPVAVGNKWMYESPDRPDAMYERNEYVIERMGRQKLEDGEYDAAILSCLNYAALEADWESRNADIISSETLFHPVSELCRANKFTEAAAKLRSIITENSSRESVDVALYFLDFLEEKINYEEKAWRFCPSAAGIETIVTENGLIKFGNDDYPSLPAGPFGTRSEENRIFGVRPFSYLDWLGGSLWKDEWKPGYECTLEDGKMRHTVTDGGTVVTPAGTFENTIHLLIDYEVDGNHDDYFHYFYNNPETGQKEYWFAPGVGIVRHKCTWGRHLQSDAMLSDYHVVAEDGEMMPIHIGNRWRYDEMLLTAENYIARRDYKVLSGMNGRYLMGCHQFFTYKGTLEEYEEFKKNL